MNKKKKEGEGEKEKVFFFGGEKGEYIGLYTKVHEKEIFALLFVFSVQSGIYNVIER